MLRAPSKRARGCRECCARMVRVIKSSLDISSGEFVLRNTLLLGALIMLLAGCSTEPITAEQQAAKADCVEITGSNVPRCGKDAKRDAGIQTLSAEELERYRTLGSGPAPKSK
jgi:hypothetical protein